MAREGYKVPPFGAAPKILIVRLSALGDTLMSTPMAQALRENFPKAFIGWVVESRCYPIVEGNPYIDRIHRWDKSLSGFFKVISEIRKEGYEFAFDPQGLFKSAIIPWLARIPFRIGFVDAREGAARFYTHLLPAPKPQPFVSDRNLQMLQMVGINANPNRHRMFFPLTEQNRQTALERLRHLDLELQNFVVFAPTTTRPQKHWLEERWSQLAERVRFDLGLPILLLASKSERPLLERISQRSQATLPIICDLNLKEAVAVVEQAKLLVGLDSFLIHAALAVETPVIALFGPNDPYRFRKESGILVLEHDLPCRPCRRHPTCGGVFTCMALITVEEVIAAIERLLSKLHDAVPK
ncbi:MAG: glycosyltransferase family 9 protein [Armatimonadetes bacterium]|nr:glycosyltransferase family 9 protein [Armatimonadota bacterium]MDW8028118.1 glycosyltransferase family 9 protein [Armatimonadota bacterium]